MTNEFKHLTRPLRNSYIVFLIIILGTLVSSQLITQYKLDNTREDATLINIAGRQRMYGQRISKQVYNISQTIFSSQRVRQNDIDTVRSLVTKFKQAHLILQKGDPEMGLVLQRNTTLKQQLDSIEPLLNNICLAGEMISNDPDSVTAIKAIEIIQQNDLKFLFAMENIVDVFEEYATEKHTAVKMVVLGLTLFAMAATLLGFAFIFMPAINRLNKSNKLIKETTDRLFLATGTAKIGIWEYDVIKDKLIWDDEMFTMYNLSQDDVSKTNPIRQWMACIHPDDVRRVKTELFSALNGKANIDTEFRIVWDNGAIRHIQAKAVSKFDKKGKVITLTGTNLDVTDLRVAEKRHKELGETLAKAQAIAHLGSWEWDIITGKEKWSDEQYRIFGYEPQEIVANYNLFVNALHPDDEDRVLQAVADALEGKKEYNEEFRIIRKDGTICNVQALGSVDRNAEGKPIKMVGTVLDITQRKKAETDLRRANLELKALFDSGNHVSTISADLNGVITYFSKGSETLLGYTADEMVGKQTPAIIHVESEVIERGEYLSQKYGREIRGFDAFVEAARQGTFDSREWTYVRKDGSTFPVQLVVTGIRDDNGNLTGFLGIATDISWQKQKATELQATLDIIGEQNKRLLNFAYIVSHNLRSHSGNMQMILNILDTAESDDERDEMIVHLKGISKSLTETIVHLNEVVHIQTNLNIQKEKINLKQYADKTIAILSGEMASKGGKIVNNIPADAVVDYNPAYMESILLNFLTNGLKYRHPDREAIVTIDLEKEEGHTVLKIKDNGLGIDLKKYGEKLFGLYKTFHKNADAKGIGLFITKSQVEAMGGKIEVESEVNIGTVFKIFF